MKTLRLKIHALMTEEERDNIRPLPLFLYLLSRIYGWGLKFNSWLYERRIIDVKKLPCRVISIGNLTVGGTGKTPMTIYIAEMIKELGFKPAVISRGYKGASEKKGGVVSDGHNILMKPAFSGDEPFMIAKNLKNIPVLVGQNRYQGGRQAVEMFSSNVIVLDDAFQHRKLHRDIDIVLIDDQALFGNGHLLPRGILREPVSALKRADACILTRFVGSSGSEDYLEKAAPGKPVFRSFHVPYIYGIFHHVASRLIGPDTPEHSEDFSFLKDAGVFIFSGIAKNEEFRRMIKEKVKNIIGYSEYPDHHPYSDHDLQDIVRRAEKCKADYVVTTEKDYARIGDHMRNNTRLAVIGIRISFGSEESGFKEFIRKKLI